MLLKDADELKKAMERMLCTGKEPDKERYTCDVVCCVIDEAPSVDAELVRHGQWKIGTVWTFNAFEPEIVEEKCSLCGRYVQRYRTQSQNNYCPNCGAKMDEGEQNATN